MLSKFVENIGSWGNRITTEEELKTSAFGGCDQPIGRSLIPIDIKVTPWYRLLGLDAENTGRSVGISTEVKPVIE